MAGVLATGVAAVVAAAGTSFIGVQGTVVGALMGAMVGSIVSELAKRELSRVEARARARLIEARRRGLPDPVGFAETVRKTLVAVRSRFSRRLLLTVGGIALGGLIVGLAAVSAIELIAGRPLSAIETGGSGGGTTVGQLVARSQSANPPPARAPLVAEPSLQPDQLVSPSPRETGLVASPTSQPAKLPAITTSPAVLASPQAEPTEPAPAPAPRPTPQLAPSPFAETTPSPSKAPGP